MAISQLNCRFLHNCYMRLVKSFFVGGWDLLKSKYESFRLQELVKKYDRPYF